MNGIFENFLEKFGVGSVLVSILPFFLTEIAIFSLLFIKTPSISA